MNNKSIKFIKNFLYTITSNMISLLSSTLVILIIPKLIGVEEYGYWQLYLFYSIYVGFLHFGWNDGIYLRYGGYNYNKLDKKLFFSQFYMLLIFQLFIAICIILITSTLIYDVNRIFIFNMVAISMVIINVRCMILYILQSTNKIKEYANITIIGRILYLFLVIVIVLMHIKEYKLMIIADLTGKTVSLIYATYCCKDIVFNKLSDFYLSFKDVKENINIGIKLMIANISSLMIIGVVRFGIEKYWDVSTFGKVSLTLSISNLMMVFIDALGIIMFPLLRRTHKNKLSNIYLTMREFLTLILLGILILYYPLRFILSIWLPKYSDSLIYMSLVFPMCLFEGKMSLLINTFLKTLRKENLILKINFLSLLLSVIITILTTVLIKNLNLAVISIVAVLGFRCILAEIFLSKIMKIFLLKNIILELIMIIIFILTGWFVDSWLVILIYLLSYLVYIYIKRKDIVVTFKSINLMVKS